MSGLPWYALWTDFPVNGKTLALCAAVKDDNAGMYVVRLYSHCATQALDGRIQCCIVESVAGWRKKRGVLLDALQATGFLEPMTNGVCLVHGWDERNGARIREWMRSNSKRKPRENPAGFSEGNVRGSFVPDVDTETDQGSKRNRATPDPIRAVGGCRGGNQ